MKVLAVAATLFATALASEYTIHHRIFHPTISLQPFVERGSLSITDSKATLVPSPDFAEDLTVFSQIIESVENPADALYQIALQPEGELVETIWDFSSVKACYLSKITTETIVLHLTGEEEPRPFAVDYFVSPINHDGSCPLSKSQQIMSPASALRTFAKNLNKINTTLIMRGIEGPSSPELKAPPPLTPEGEVVKPVPEKNFLQKYWMYIGAVLLVVLVSGGAEEEQPKRR